MRLTKRQIAEIRAEIGKGGLDAALLAAQLLEMVEKLHETLDTREALLADVRREAAKAMAALAQERLALEAALEAECRQCPSDAARGMLERLRSVARGRRAAGEA